MKICAAQIRSVAGDIEVNTAQHLRLIELAAAQGANCVFFPNFRSSRLARRAHSFPRA